MKDQPMSDKERIPRPQYEDRSILEKNQTLIDKVVAISGRRPKVKATIAAPYLGLSVVTVENDRATKALGIPFHRLGRACVYDLDELDAWLESRRNLT